MRILVNTSQRYHWSYLKLCGHDVAVELIVGIVLLGEVVNLHQDRRDEAPFWIEPEMWIKIFRFLRTEIVSWKKVILILVSSVFANCLVKQQPKNLVWQNKDSIELLW